MGPGAFFSGREKVSPTLSSMFFAALAVAARLPYLLSHKIAFDSDEAVEGLMARHVLHGELPAFFWGQAFKGVPEVYVSAGAFAVFGPSVTVLKSVTLAFFAVFVALNFTLLDRMAGRWIATAASLLLIACPPALVFWSLDASAEYILIMLLGTSFLLLCLRYQGGERAESTDKRARVLGAIGFVVGLSLWVHQIFVFYLVPASLIFVFQSEWWKRRAFGRISAATLALAALGALYAGLAVVAFLTGGFALQVGSVTLGARAPQKLLRIAAGIGAIALIVHLLANMPRTAGRRLVWRYWTFAAAFAIGYSPVLLYSVFVEPARSPARVANLKQLMGAMPDIAGNIVPILAGFKIATTDRLPIPLPAATVIVGVLAAYLWSIGKRLAVVVTNRRAESSLASDFFPLFFVWVPLLFLVSGAYLDTQSYRYLVPYYAGLSVAVAGGCLVLGRFIARAVPASRTPGRPDLVLATLCLAVILAVHTWQQVLWYRWLSPDTRSAKVIECLQREGIRGGFADYWTSYKLTFLSNEEIILAPRGVTDRYPAFTDFVRSLPENSHKVDECVVSP